MKSKKNLIIIALVIAISLTGITYAFFEYYKLGVNQKITAGKVSLLFNEGTDTIDITNIFPETVEQARKEGRTDNVITFTVSGINTTEDQDIWYEIMLNEGDSENGMTRFDSEDLVFDLVELDKDGNEVTYLVDAMSFNDFNARRIWVNTVYRETATVVNKTYKLRMWLSENVLISDTDPNADYPATGYENHYASVSVSVHGDFVEKELPYNYMANLGVEGSTFWPESIENVKANITEVNFITMTKDLINTRYEAATIKEDVTDTIKSNGGSVKAWLETNSNDNTKYTMYVASNGITFLPEDSSRMFNEFPVLESVLFENINTRYTTTLERMFRNCKSLLDVDVSGFDTSNVTNMSVMFQNCSKLTKLDVSKWDTSGVTSMLAMFNKCSGLTELDVRNWNTSMVTSMYCLFQGCSTLISLDVSAWNTSKVTDMTGMFAFCGGLTNLDVSSFNTSNVTTMQAMFNDCINLVNLDVSAWNTSNVTNMSYMFSGNSDMEMLLMSLDVSKWNTSKVTNMSVMFQNCVNLETLDVSGWDTSQVTTMKNMFNDCSNLVTIYANTDWNSGKITSDASANMFDSCTSLVGVTSYSDSNANDITMANPTTGYFTKKEA